MREQKTGYIKFWSFAVKDIPEIEIEDRINIVEENRDKHLLELDRICDYDYGIITIPTTKGNVGFFLIDVYSETEGLKMKKYFNNQYGNKADVYIKPFNEFLRITHQSLT